MERADPALVFAPAACFQRVTDPTCPSRSRHCRVFPLEPPLRATYRTRRERQREGGQGSTGPRKIGSRSVAGSPSRSRGPSPTRRCWSEPPAVRQWLVGGALATALSGISRAAAFHQMGEPGDPAPSPTRPLGQGVRGRHHPHDLGVAAKRVGSRSTCPLPARRPSRWPYKPGGGGPTSSSDYAATS